MTLPAILLPYQQQWLADQSPVRVWEKSRRIGASWTDAAESSLVASAAGGMDAWYIGYNKDMAREYIEDAAAWARHFQKAAEAIEEMVFANEGLEGKDILAFRIKFASGAKVVSLSSRPSNLRGKQGKITIDEAAFHQDLAGLLKAAIAVLMWGGRVAVISSHHGEGNRFNHLVKEIRAGEKPYSLHRTTLDDALAGGLYRRIALKLGRDWTPEAEAQWRQELIDYYGADADEELFCVPGDEAGAFLPYDLIMPCEDEQAGRPDLAGSGPFYVGMDIARRRDLTVIRVLEQVGDVLWTRELVRLKGASFLVQDQELDRVFEQYRPKRICMDQTGMGEKPLEDAKRRYGAYVVEGVLFTATVKQELAFALRRKYEDRQVRTPIDVEDRRAHHAVKKTVTVAGNIRFDAERTEAGHADEFWAHALAVHAAGGLATGQGIFEFYRAAAEKIKQEDLHAA